MDFTTLIRAIEHTDEHFSAKARHAVNANLTFRNWVIGCHIQEYEQNGNDRAEYGSELFKRLSADLKQTGRLVYHPRELRRCRQFYRAYPQIGGTLSPKSKKLLPPTLPIEKRGTLSPKLLVTADELITTLSYSHFAELLTIEDAQKRAFYEAECIQGAWSVRELKRQIATLLCERTGLSTDKAKLADSLRNVAETNSDTLAIRDPYIFEFLGIKPSEVMGESSLEDALLDKIQEFLLELGKGFCLEARQKRIRIGDEYFFVDLVFYHRILKCHVLIELKVDEFKHEHLGQLNTYVNWFHKNEMTGTDNPPIGLLLCTQKNHALLEYALAAMDNQLFVSRYQLELPKKEDLEKLLESELRQNN